MSVADPRLLADPDFIAFCACWEADGRCPLGLADWLRDRDLHGHADAAEWAATEPDREYTGGALPSPGGVYPNGFLAFGRAVFAWGAIGKHETARVRHLVPDDVFLELPDFLSWKGGSTFPGAILALLSAWAAARGKGAGEFTGEDRTRVEPCDHCGGSGREPAPAT